MRIKKILWILIILTGIGATNVYADVIGEVLCTDIGTLIDDSPIESYNINDYTYVVAEDLVKYGFDVIWDGENRTLDINHDVHKGYQVALSMEKVNIKKEEIPMRKHYAYVYSTDIKTYLDGQRIDACNIDGRTMIQVDHLGQYGEFYYDNAKRMVEIRIMKPSFEYGIRIAEDKVETEVDFYPGKYRRKVKYLGLVNSQGSPYGIGKVSENDEAPEVTYAYWDGYERKDTYYTEKREMNSKAARHYGYSGKNRQDSVISIFGEGDDPYTMVCTGRYEYDGRVVRGGIYNKEYLYGFFISYENFYDKDGAAINYTGAKSAEFSAVMADKRFAQIAYAKATDGKVYAAGYSGANEDTGWESTGNPYKVFVRTGVNDFPSSPTKPTTDDWLQYSAADAGAYNHSQPEQ